MYCQCVAIVRSAYCHSNASGNPDYYQFVTISDNTLNKMYTPFIGFSLMPVYCHDIIFWKKVSVQSQLYVRLPVACFFELIYNGLKAEVWFLTFPLIKGSNLSNYWVKIQQ